MTLNKVRIWHQKRIKECPSMQGSQTQSRYAEPDDPMDDMLNSDSDSDSASISDVDTMRSDQPTLIYISIKRSKVL